MSRATAAFVFISLAACATQDPPVPPAQALVPSKQFEPRAGKPVADLPGEPHLRNVRQLTFDGENAEAYWSNDGTRLILQRRGPDMPADQIYVFDLGTGDMKLVSTGKGRTTCSYFMQGDQRILFASTHHHGDAPPVIEMPQGQYVWAVYPEFDIFTARPDGSDLQPLTDTPGYDAEATCCPVTGDIVFTTDRDGDLELYTMTADGKNLHRVTNRQGYDGGAFFSHDGTRLVLRSAYPKDEKEAEQDKELLQRSLVRPSRMEITVCNRDGSDFRQVTHNGAANFAPYYTMDDKRIIFCSNVGGIEEMKKTGNHMAARNFDIYLVDVDGNNLERVTNYEEFDGFPMFSPNGKYLAFASNRYGSSKGNTNIFVAEWVEHPAAAK